MLMGLLVAAKMLLTAPQSAIGVDRQGLRAGCGAPKSVATDFRAREPEGSQPDEVITLDWPELRVRLYRSAATQQVSLLGVTTTSDVLKLDGPVRIGASRHEVVRAMGEPIYEDDSQLIYSLMQEDPREPNQNVRIVFKDDRVVGFDWTYPIE